MLNSLNGCFVIVNLHFTNFQSFGNAVEKDNRSSAVDEWLEMGVIGSFGRDRNSQSIDFFCEECFGDCFLGFVVFV